MFRRSLIWMVALGCAATTSALAFTFEEQAAIYDSYALEAKRDYEGSAQRMMAVYKANRGEFFVNLRLGWLFSYAGKHKNSINHYEAAAGIEPKAVEPWLALSLLYLNLGKPEKSLAASAEILKRDPGNYYGLLRTVTALIRTKRYAEGLVVVNKALEFYPIDATFLEQKGFLLVSTGNSAAAKGPLQLLLLISPQHPYAKSILKK